MALRPLAYSLLIAMAVSGQPAPKFEAADVRAIPPTTQWESGPYLISGRYEVKRATLLDLIQAAYSLDEDKILGGPTWLAWDHFDVTAKLPSGSNSETRNLMLQDLLAERFALKVHKDTVPMAAWALTAGKHAGLKPADLNGEPGCKASQQPPLVSAEGTVTLPKTAYTCRNMTMKAFAEAIPELRFAFLSLAGQPVIDQTSLSGAWDFSFQYSPPARGRAVEKSELISLPEALDKQLGLKLEAIKTPMPVLVVDSANRTPASNPPDTAAKLGSAPTEFEVAEIKPAVAPTGRAPFPTILNGEFINRPPDFKNGRLLLSSCTPLGLIALAWGIEREEALAGAPKGLDSDRYDVIAKVPGEGPSTRDEFDFESVRPMLRKLLTERFKLAVHFEDRPGSTYALVAAKPKLQAADPTRRSQCQDPPVTTDPKDPRVANPALTRLMRCQNVTMAQFAELLPMQASGYIRTAVSDATGLEGAYDFTLSFSSAGIVNGAKRVAADATDPSGGLSLFDALTKQLGLKLEPQKRPMPVLVIDHTELKPTDN